MAQAALTTRAVIPALTVAALLAFSGCSRNPGWLDRRDQSLPLAERAAERATAGDIESAIRLYEKALEQSPEAARVHLDLAFLLHDYRKDYVGAIYHYRRYNALRPDAEKRPMVDERIRLARQVFAADILGPSRMSERVEELERENEALRQQIGDLSRRIVARQEPAPAPRKEPEKPAARTDPAPRTAQAPASHAGGTYRVKRGDTLSSIAIDVYGDVNRWKEIQLANSDILGNSSQVKVGQVLVIP